jgi:hypothetical protein
MGSSERVIQREFYGQTVEEVQNDPAQFAKQVPIEQLFSDIANGSAPAFSYIVPDQCRDMHGLGNVLAPCGGVNDTDANDVKRGDDETFWIVNADHRQPDMAQRSQRSVRCVR